METNNLITSGLRFIYNSSASFNFPDVNCESGKRCLIMEPSGCGKTSFLHLIATTAFGKNNC